MISDQVSQTPGWATWATIIFFLYVKSISHYPWIKIVRLVIWILGQVGGGEVSLGQPYLDRFETRAVSFGRKILLRASIIFAQRLTCCKIRISEIFISFYYLWPHLTQQPSSGPCHVCGPCTLSGAWCPLLLTRHVSSYPPHCC